MYSVEDIIKVTSKAYGITPEEITGKKRDAITAGARQMVAYLTRELLHKSFPYIGEKLGNRDHTTVLHAYKKVRNDLATSQESRGKLELILRSLEGYKKESSKKPKDVWTRMKNGIEKEALAEYSNLNIEITEREKKILKCYRDGDTLEKIARVLGLTRERIRQIVQRSLMKELIVRARNNEPINIANYFRTEKDAHEKTKRLRIKISSDLPFLESGNLDINYFTKKYELSLEELLRILEINTVLEKEIKNDH